ncbi:MAG: DUF192 domain-containing protein [Pseudomonadota bacterium]
MVSRRQLRLCVALLCVLWATATHAQTLPEKPIDFDQLRAYFEPIDVIASAANLCVSLDVIVADTRAQKARGLMYVRNMPPRAGMLFDYEQPRQMSMWMKNTLIPLDILFIDADGDVINIARDTTPLSLDSISTVAPARYVLELNAGVADALQLAAGATLHIFRRR